MRGINHPLGSQDERTPLATSVLAAESPAKASSPPSISERPEKMGEKKKKIKLMPRSSSLPPLARQRGGLEHAAAGLGDTHEVPSSIPGTASSSSGMGAWGGDEILGCFPGIRMEAGRKEVRNGTGGGSGEKKGEKEEKKGKEKRRRGEREGARVRAHLGDASH